MKQGRKCALCLLLALAFFPAPVSPGLADVTVVVTNPEYAEDQTDEDQGGAQDGSGSREDGSQTQQDGSQNQKDEEKVQFQKDFSVTYTDPKTKKSYPAEYKQLGTAYSVITLKDGKTLTVATSTLTFDKNVPRDHMLAVVYAPKYGRASMRKGASKKSAMFNTCYPGIVVAVLKTGKSYTKINYHGIVGYLKTTSLQFHAPENVKKLATGKLSYKGKMTGKTTVNVRNDPSKKVARVATWPTGTAVTILGESKGWAEIEARGVRGYVQTEFLTRD